MRPKGLPATQLLEDLPEEHRHPVQIKTGLTVQPMLDTNTYEKGIKITDQEMKVFEALTCNETTSTASGTTRPCTSLQVRTRYARINRANFYVLPLGGTVQTQEVSFFREGERVAALSHAVSLFDLNQKYADVRSSREVQYFATLAGGGAGAGT